MGDGTITIECLAKTDKFDKEMQRLEKKISKQEQEKIMIEAEIKGYEREIRQYEELGKKANEYQDKLRQLNEQKKRMFKEDKTLAITNETIDSSAKDYANIKAQISEIKQEYKEIVTELDRQQPAISRAEEELERMKIKQEQNTIEATRLKKDLDKIEMTKAQKGIQQFHKSLGKVGNSIGNQIKSVGRWALAIFGIRTALSLISRASSTISQYDEQYATNLEYIRWALAMSIKPILEYIVNLIATILQYINYIASAWFGVQGGIFKSADAFQSAKNNLGGMAKSAKEVQKSLAGFDEINKLNDDSSASGGTAGATGGVMPNIDISGMQGEVPSWLQWIVDNKDIILSVLAGILAFVTGLKLGFTGLQSLGLGVAITGIMLTIQAILEYLKDPTWENFGKVIGGIALVVLGIGIAFSSTIGIVAGVVGLILALVVGNWDKIREVLQGAIDWLKEKADWIEQNFSKTAGAVFDNFIAVFQFLLDEWDLIFTTWKKVFDKIIEFFKNVFSGNWEGAWNNIKEIVWILIEAVIKHFQNMFNFVLRIAKNFLKFLDEASTVIAEFLKASFNGVVSLGQKAGKFVVNVINGIIKLGEKAGEFIGEKIKELFNNIGKWFEDNWKNITEGIEDIKGKVKEIPDKIKEWFGNAWENILSTFERVWNKIVGLTSENGDFFEGIKEGISSVFKTIVNALITGINAVISQPFSVINGLLNTIKGTNIMGLQPFQNFWDWDPIPVPQIPKLATGGIINYPNRGVGLGGMAIGGESGREGVIPLTDTQAMQELGEAIGRYITINATINNNMDGRLMSRNTQRITQRRTFEGNL